MFFYILVVAYFLGHPVDLQIHTVTLPMKRTETKIINRIKSSMTITLHR